MADRHAPFGVLLALVALAVAGRLAFVWLPNVSPVFVIAFTTGAAFGWRAGAAVGGFSMIATDVMLTGLHPVAFVNAPAMALVGAFGAALTLVVDLGQDGRSPRRLALATAAFVGVASVVAFSVAADTLSFALFYRNGVAGLVTLVVAGLAFNALPAAVNGAVFALATPRVLNALRHAGLTTGRGAPTPRPSPE